MELTQLDLKNFDKNIGKVFYYICPDDENYYRTVYVKYNFFNNVKVPMISNPLYGTPPEGMEPISPLYLAQLMRNTMTTATNF
jgi:hypothetical protein